MKEAKASEDVEGRERGEPDFAARLLERGLPGADEASLLMEYTREILVSSPETCTGSSLVCCRPGRPKRASFPSPSSLPPASSLVSTQIAMAEAGRPTFPPGQKRYSSSADLYSIQDTSPLQQPQAQLPTTPDEEEGPSSWRQSYNDFKPHRGSARYSQGASTLVRSVICFRCSSQPS